MDFYPRPVGTFGEILNDPKEEHLSYLKSRKEHAVSNGEYEIASIIRDIETWVKDQILIKPYKELLKSE